MERGQRVFVVMKLNPWSDMRVNISPGLDVSGPGCGFLAVYETEEQARRENEGCDVMALRITIPETSPET